MARYILRRLGALLPVLLVASFITFMLGQMASGDTARILAEKEFGRPNLEQIEMIREKMGFNRPALVQYADWLGRAVRGDLGTSFSSGRPVTSELIRLFPKTLQLSAWALLFLVLISFTLGILSAVLRERPVDRLSQVYCFFSASIPEFWLALLLLFFFGARLGLVSVLGGSTLKYPILPAFVMAVCASGVYVRLVKTGMEEALGRGYVRAARAKGVTEWKVVVVHALKNAILPVFNKLGITFGSMLAGSAVIESIFSWNGLGKLALESVKSKDFPVIQGFVLAIAVLIVCINLLVDILCTILDPRLKTE